MIRRYIREKVFSIARHELAAFLKDHEEELLHEFRKTTSASSDAGEWYRRTYSIAEEELVHGLEVE